MNSAFRPDLSRISDAGRRMIDASSKEGKNEALEFVVLTMATLGLKELSEENLEEAAFRFKAYQNALGTPLKDEKGNPAAVTRNELESLSGLRINVTPTTRTNFSKWLADACASDYREEHTGAFSGAHFSENETRRNSESRVTR